MTTPTTLPSSSFRKPKRSPLGVGSALVLLAAMAVPFGGCLNEFGVPGGGEPCNLEGAVKDPEPSDCWKLVCTNSVFIGAPGKPDDGNPCTNDACSGGQPQHTPRSEGACKIGPEDGVCEGGTCVITCMVSSDCDDANPCTGDLCAAGQCKFVPDDSLKPDDGNPCTADSCNGGMKVFAPLKDAPCGGGGTGKCNGNGECVGCTADADCGTDDVCNDRYCNTTSGMCITAPKQDGPAGDPNPGDCLSDVCTGGQLQTIPNEFDKPDDGIECTQDLCANGNPSHPGVAAGTPCESNNACDGNGVCRDCANGVGCESNQTCVGNTCERCNDGTQNNGETDVDCGGPNCGNTCTPGKTCGNGNDCASGTCFEGICCNTACNGVCEACVATKSTGQNGICSPIKAGTDPYNECAGADNCSGMAGKCGCQDGVKNGTETGTDCGGGTCGKCPNSQPCNMNSDCTSNYCVDGVCCNALCGGTCSACNLPNNKGTCVYVPKGDDDPTGSTVCTGSMSCDGSGSCLKENGQPCMNDNECLSNYCPTTGNPKYLCQP